MVPGRRGPSRLRFLATLFAFSFAFAFLAFPAPFFAFLRTLSFLLTTIPWRPSWGPRPWGIGFLSIPGLPVWPVVPILVPVLRMLPILRVVTRRATLLERMIHHFSLFPPHLGQKTAVFVCTTLHLVHLHDWGWSMVAIAPLMVSMKPASREWWCCSKRLIFRSCAFVSSMNLCLCRNHLLLALDRALLSVLLCVGVILFKSSSREILFEQQEQAKDNHDQIAWPPEHSQRGCSSRGWCQRRVGPNLWKFKQVRGDNQTNQPIAKLSSPVQSQGQMRDQCQQGQKECRDRVFRGSPQTSLAAQSIAKGSRPAVHQREQRPRRYGPRGQSHTR